MMPRLLVLFVLALSTMLSGCASDILGLPTKSQMTDTINKQDYIRAVLQDQKNSTDRQNDLIAEQNKELKRIADALEALEKKK